MALRFHLQPETQNHRSLSLARGNPMNAGTLNLEEHNSHARAPLADTRGGTPTIRRGAGPSAIIHISGLKAKSCHVSLHQGKASFPAVML
eukprot:4894248-Pyramimonas_sp.AAC.1